MLGRRAFIKSAPITGQDIWRISPQLESLCAVSYFVGVNSFDGKCLSGPMIARLSVSQVMNLLCTETSYSKSETWRIAFLLILAK